MYITSVLVLAATALAAPQEPYSGALVARAPETADDCQRAGVFICQDFGWGGSCTLYNNCVGGAPSQCTQLDGQASSIGPDRGFNCSFFKNGNCDDIPGDSGGKLTLAWPGSSYLGDVNGQNWNDVIRSYQCFNQ